MKRTIRKEKSGARDNRKRAPAISREELSELRNSLREARETLEAIRGGEVDAVVVSGSGVSRIYTLAGADQPYRVYVEHMQEGAATVSRDGHILYANRRFAGMVNQPLEHVISVHASRFISHAAWEKIRAVFESQDTVVKFETFLQPEKGVSLPVNLTASFLPLEGQPVLCLVVTDLSAQKLNEELRLAKELAEKANSGKDAFIAALSHELRTPLNPILLLSSDWARDKSLPDNVRSDFATIRDNIELEARLIDDLLDLNRITRGKLTLQVETVDCIAALKRAIAMVEPDLKRKKIELVTQFKEARFEFPADATRLQQIFWNVLKNAAKFTPDRGKIKITAAVDRFMNRLTIEVSDTGIGMAPDELPQIFDAFIQGHHARGNGVHKFGGLGLGLAITRALVNLHEGTIAASSDGPGKGSTFTIQLPCSGIGALPAQNNLLRAEA